MEQKTMALYAENDREGFDVMRVTRGGRGYGEAALSLASAIWNNKNELHVIDVKNQGAIQGMDNDVVVETTCLVNKSGVYPLMMDTLPLHTLAFLQAVKKYEVLTVKAAVEGNYHAALEALVANPLVTSFNQAKAALDELLIAHKQYLPKFSKVVDCLEHDENPLLMEKSFRKFG
jgi:6-phospho-beta-glucosidase